MADTALVAPVAAPPAPVAAVQRKLRPGNFRLDLSGYVNNQWSAVLDEADAVEDALGSDFWFHVDKTKINQGDTIVVFTHDRQRRVVLYVRAVTKAVIKLGVMSDNDFNPKGRSVDDDALLIKWNVGKRRYEVLSESTKSVLQSDFLVKEDATAWIAQHKKAMAA